MSDEDDDRRTAIVQSVTPAESEGSMRLSMHDGVAVWCDCCSCEAEPYWAAMAEEPEVGLGDHPGAASNSPRRGD